MKVLVTGATGYIGHNLALALAQNGEEVNILVRNPGSTFIPRHPAINIYRGDITEKSSILPAIRDCEKVFHTAALVQYCASNPSAFYDINVEGTRHVLDAALQARVKTFVFTSTAAVIGPSLNKPMNEADPRITGFENDYELSKCLAEKLVVDYAGQGLFTAIATATKVYGPGIETHSLSVNSVIRRFIRDKICFCPRPADYISNYVFIDDLVRGHIQVSERGRKGEKYILGGENLTYTEFFRLLRTATGKKGKLLPVTKNIAALYGGWHFIQSKLYRREPFFNAKGVSQFYCNKSFSSSKAMEELGYIITPFARGAQQTVHFLKTKRMNKDYYTLITGASEGLGKALALECAGRNMNLILVALPGPELYALAGLIKSNYSVRVICIGKDLCRNESCLELYNEVTALDIPVNMLINNAGIGSTVLFEEGSIAFYEKQIRLNVLATTLITRLFLTTLQRNDHSYILNVGSMASFFYLPKKQVYGATKSFIYFFSKSLRKELKETNVHVSVLCPGGMNTNLPLTLMNKTGNCLSRLSVMNPEEVVPFAIDGLLKRKEVIIPGKLNKFFMFLDKVLPEAIKKMITNHGMKKLKADNHLTQYLAPALIPIKPNLVNTISTHQHFIQKIT